MKYSFTIWPLWESGDRDAERPIDMQVSITCALAVCRETATVLPLTIRVPKSGPPGTKPHFDHYMAQLDFTTVEMCDESLAEVGKMTELAFANRLVMLN